MDIVQISILVLGASNAWLLSRKEKWRRWGYILGMMGQPFWIYSTVQNKQWGIFALALFYIYCWGQGIYNFWIKKES